MPSFDPDARLQKFLRTPTRRGVLALSLGDQLSQVVKGKSYVCQILESHTTPREGEDHLGHWESEFEIHRDRLEEGGRDLLDRAVNMTATNLSIYPQINTLSRLLDIGGNIEEIPTDWEGHLVLNAQSLAKLVSQNPDNVTSSPGEGGPMLWGPNKAPILTSRVPGGGMVLVLPPPIQLGSLRSRFNTECVESRWGGGPQGEPPAYVVKVSYDAWVDWHPVPEAWVYQLGGE